MSLFLGGHQVKLGGDYQKDLTSGFSYYSGGQSLTIFPCRQGVRNNTCDLTKAPFMDVAAGHIQVFYSHVYYVANGQDLTPTASSPFNAFSTSWSAYVQDEWKVLPNLSVNLGVRYDRQKVYKGDDTVAMDLKDQWAPRVGVSWDPLKDGSSKVYASAGRFYYNTPTDLNVQVFTAKSSVGAVNYSPTGLTQDPTAPRPGYVSLGTADGQPVDPGTKQAYQDEFTIGLEKALDPTFSLGAKFTYRTLGRTIEDRVDLDPNDPANPYGFSAFFNPGGSGPVASGAIPTCNSSENPTDPHAGECGLPGVAMPAAKRIYRGIELLARKRVGESLWLQASYLYSTLRGNYSGAIRTASGQTDPGFNTDFDFYQLLDNADGNLELDHPHSFRVDGFWTAPFGLQAGLGFWVAQRSADVPDGFLQLMGVPGRTLPRSSRHVRPDADGVGCRPQPRLQLERGVGRHHAADLHLPPLRQPAGDALRHLLQPLRQLCHERGKPLLRTARRGARDGKLPGGRSPLLGQPGLHESLRAVESASAPSGRKDRVLISEALRELLPVVLQVLGLHARGRRVSVARRHGDRERGFRRWREIEDSLRVRVARKKNLPGRVRHLDRHVAHRRAVAEVRLDVDPAFHDFRPHGDVVGEGGPGDRKQQREDESASHETTSRRRRSGRHASVR